MGGDCSFGGIVESESWRLGVAKKMVGREIRTCSNSWMRAKIASIVEGVSWDVHK